MNITQWKVGIFLFDDVEVFSVTELENGDKRFIVETLSEKGAIVDKGLLLWLLYCLLS